MDSLALIYTGLLISGFLSLCSCSGMMDVTLDGLDSEVSSTTIQPRNSPSNYFEYYGQIADDTLNHVSRVDEYSSTNSISGVEKSTTSSLNPDIPCQNVRQQNESLKCKFVQSTSDCAIDEGFINYINVVFCVFPANLLPLAMIITIFWWFVLFIALAVTADDFFCPSLVVIAKTLRMSDNIAGVTLMAFGNGAPDVFSAIAAIGNMKDGDAGLAVGALIGAGIFVTTVVAGSVAIVKPFHAMERPFLRDIIFYLAALFMTFYVLYKNVITIVQAGCFIGLYILYVIVVVVGRYIYKRTGKQRKKSRLEPSGDGGKYGAISEQTDVHSSIENADYVVRPISRNGELLDPATTRDNRGNSNQTDQVHSERTELTPLIGSDSSSGQSASTVKEFLEAVSPIDTEKWHEMRWFLKVYEIIKILPQFVLILTVPIVDYQSPKNKWNRHLSCIHCITAPLCALFCAHYESALYQINGSFPVWALLFLVCITISVIVFFTSKNDEPPKYHWVFAYIGFVTAVLWISTIANEIVNILQMFGIVFNLSNAVLGLTLLAWGNSLGDLVADTTMARQGFPRTGISACFGGPVFNLLLGVGIPFTIKTIRSGPVALNFTSIQVLLLVTLCLSLLSSLIILPLLGFRVDKRYGIYLYIVYAVFLVLAILMEVGVIKVQF